MSLPDLSTTANVPLPGHDITIKEMYNIAMRNNTAWGIEGYSVPRHYQDPKKTGEKKPAPRALKNADYLTDHLRATKSVPAPNHYEIMKPWVNDKDKPKPLKHITKKNSYIDNIIRAQTLKPTPGPGAHNLRETEEQLKARLAKHKGAKGSDRINFLCEVEYLSEKVPGPGNYNPREIMPKIKEVKLKPEDWKKKHGEDAKKNKKSTFPDVGTFNPHPVAFKTFSKEFELRKEKKDQKIVKMWGTAPRFVMKKDNKKDPNNFPGPGNYDMRAKWNGKSTEKKPKDLNWMNRITKGIEKSIYYS
jgi:hypothetical protein